jgi:hypothetical protein
MKIALILIFVALIPGCGADTSSNDEPDREPEMFEKKSTQTYVISSPMQGVLVNNGEPLANTKITRHMRWVGNDEGLVEEFVTDQNGYFSLPVHEESLALGMLTQFSSSTHLQAEIDGETFDIWYNNKFEADVYAEAGIKLNNVVCDLSAAEVVVQAELSKIMTICRWSDMPDPEFF